MNTNVNAMSTRTKLAVTITTAIALIAGSVGYLGWVNHREAAAAKAAATDTGLPEPDPIEPQWDGALWAINRSPGPDYGAITRIDTDGTVTRVGTETCDVIARGGDTLACLTDDGPEGTRLTFIDPTTGASRVTHYETGLPSRVQVSADGKWASFTTFVEGHSYVTPGQFSTWPVIIDVASGIHATVEMFATVDQNGKPVTAIDRNFWGMAFDPTDTDTFYAAIQYNANTYIVRGSAQNRAAEIIIPGYGCPTPSPDGTHLIIRDEHTLKFLLHDLSTGETTPLNEDRLSDDQARWVDNDTIIYSLPADNPGSAEQPATDLWALNVKDGSGPVRVTRAASSATT